MKANARVTGHRYRVHPSRLPQCASPEKEGDGEVDVSSEACEEQSTRAWSNVTGAIRYTYGL